MDREPLPLKQLIECLETDRDWAVQELVDRYGNYILMVVRRHLGRRMRLRFDSEDFVQAVWATLFLKPSAFQQIESEAQLIAFLARIAFNKVIDERRANTKTQKRMLDREVPLPHGNSSGEQLPVLETTASAYLIADEEMQRLQAEIPKEFQWMLDRRLHGLTYEAIAEEGGFHERTVRRVFERLKRKILHQ